MDDDKMSYLAKLEAERDELRERVRSLEAAMAELRSDAAMMADVRDNLQAQLEDMSRARKRLESENAALRQATASGESVGGGFEASGNKLSRDVLAAEQRSNREMFRQISELVDREKASMNREKVLTQELEATRQGNRELLAEREELRKQVVSLGELGQQLRENCSRANVRAARLLETKEALLEAKEVRRRFDEDDSDDDDSDDTPLADGVTSAYLAALVAMLVELTSGGVEVVLRRDGALVRLRMTRTDP